MVYFPEFWYRGETTAGGYRFNFALDKIDDTWKYAPASLVGAYKARLRNNKLYSESGVESAVNISMAEFSTRARSRGAGYHIIDYQQHCIIAWMFYARYLTRDSQGVCGAGKSAYSGLKCGSTNTLGITDTTTSNATSSSNLHVNFLGIEGCWGYKYEWIEGIHSYVGDAVIAYDKGDYHDQTYVNTSSSTKRRVFTGPNESGCIREIAAGEYMDMCGKIFGDSSSTYFCDYCGCYTSSSHVFRRSHYSNSAYGGVACLIGAGSSSYTAANIGSRLAFDGTITVASSVSAFKSLSLL